MMHRNDFVVSILPVGGKAFREFQIDKHPDTNIKHKHEYSTGSGLTRTRRINIGFNQEYEFKFKNMKNVRRSVVVVIDGNKIGSWVIDAGSKTCPHEATLERFSDSNKRFKALCLSDGGVDDPNNKDNGIIKIIVTDEMPPPQITKTFGGILRSCGGHAGGSSVNYSATIGVVNNDTFSADSVSACSMNLGSSNVATGEGSKSNQEFSTTYWHGDSGEPFIFVYKLVGIVQHNEFKNYCGECGSNVLFNYKFCSNCGTKIANYGTSLV